eukprot:TRINITY_DN543_c0_g1_i2.p1 TRINITY_DN543_c0_g1~~TRINITY_DN543_c0_g1_i2.p1  ORF type:complete len:102 (-),score=14.15 TRINITY_DN543_c0_g1_i2:131-436(-)
MIRRPPRSTRVRSSAASDVYKRQVSTQSTGDFTTLQHKLEGILATEKARDHLKDIVNIQDFSGSLIWGHLNDLQKTMQKLIPAECLQMCVFYANQLLSPSF